MTSLARLVFPSLRWREKGGFAHERAKIDGALAAGVGGFIIFGGDRESVVNLTRDLRRQAGRRLLIGADLERGPGQQVAGLTELPPPAALGHLGDVETTRLAGLITGTEAIAAGINWVFAPVCDLDNEPRNPIVQTRSFGADPSQVSEHVAAWITACQEHGAMACAKHYPGHGRTTQDSHAVLPRVDASFDELARSDLVPFGAAVKAGVASVMSAFVSYPGWDSSAAAAGFSPTILGYLRKDLGFVGLVVTDALIMAGATARESEGPATATAVAAGCDALLYPQDYVAVVSALDSATGRALPTARADAALALYDAAVSRWDGGADQGEPDLRSHAQAADQIADRVVTLLRGAAPALRPPCIVSIVDDDVGGPYTVGPRDVYHHTLAAAGVSILRTADSRSHGSRIVLVYAEPRSWKGRAELGSRSLQQLAHLLPKADLVILLGHPRLAGQITGHAPIVCCWHGQPLMQRAAARWSLQRMEPR